MSKYRSFGALDTQFQSDGDAQFRGIDEKHDRALLEPGMVAKSINKRLRTGVAETRPGTRMFRNLNAPSGQPGVLGSIVYKNPNGHEQLLVAEVNHPYVWAFEDGQPDKQVFMRGVTTGLGSGPTVWFVQAFDKVLMLRKGLIPLVWDGIDYGVVAGPTGGFHPISKLDPADTSTQLIGAPTYGIPFQSRVLYQQGKDTIVMSDVLDYTSFDPILAKFRINAGEADEIVCMHEYGRDTIAVFMKRSIHLLSNFTIDPNLAQQTCVSDELGTVGREAAVHVGADIIFLSHSGIYRLSQVLDTQVIAAPVPISDLISPTIKNIAWDLIDSDGDKMGYCSMAVLGDYCYVTVPLANTQPRNVLVYNTVTAQWESVDAWEDANVFVNDLRVTVYQGEQRLFAINRTQFSCIYLMYEGITDQTETVTKPVNDILETRGYLERNQYGPTGVVEWKRFERLSLSIRTRNPSITISALTDGYNEQKTITPVPITKSTAKFYLFAHPDFVSATDNPDEPYRQDYYQGETDWVAQDMSNLIPGHIDLLPAVDAEMLGGPTTESIERRPIRVMGRWCSIRIANTQGICDIIACQIDIKPTRSDVLTLA